MIKKWDLLPKKVSKYNFHYQRLIRKLKFAKIQKHNMVYSDTCHTYLQNKQLHILLHELASSAPYPRTPGLFSWSVKTSNFFIDEKWFLVIFELNFKSRSLFDLTRSLFFWYNMKLSLVKSRCNSFLDGAFSSWIEHCSMSECS